MSTHGHRQTQPSLRSRVGLDAIAIKPAECEVSSAVDVPVDTLAIDYEGREYLPDDETLATLAAESTATIRLTTPVRVDGFDPMGDDSRLETLPEGVGRVLVAGHPAYLSPEEQRRAIAPRLGTALETAPDAWVGTESVERIAMATGATQYDLLTRSTERTLHALRTAGFDGDIAVYAPTVLTADADAVLDAIGDYVARRRPVAQALPEPDSDEVLTDSSATGRTREVLLEAAGDYALVGTEAEVRERVDELRAAGATTIVGYPARGLEELFE